MRSGRRVLCVIPARGGSKGVPGKNTRLLCGKPLIAFSIEQALSCDSIDRVVVSTEDVRIAEIAQRYGAEVPFMRPAELASDDAGTIDVLIHVLDELSETEDYEPDILVLLHATAPLRLPDDIDAAVDLLVDTGAPNVFSAAPARNNPYYNMVEVAEDGRVALSKPASFATRQEAPPVFDLNASIYAWWTGTLKAERRVVLPASRVYVMPRERSIDVDDEVDFITVEALMRRRLE